MENNSSKSTWRSFFNQAESAWRFVASKVNKVSKRDANHVCNDATNVYICSHNIEVMINFIYLVSEVTSTNNTSPINQINFIYLVSETTSANNTSPSNQTKFLRLLHDSLVTKLILLYIHLTGTLCLCQVCLRQS